MKPYYYDHLHGDFIEQDSYEMNIENWANNLMELEKDYPAATPLPTSQSSTQTSIIPLSPTYYRSKAFSNTVSINNLINAADPILTLVTKLYKIATPPDPSLLHQNLCHEIKAFENKAQTLGYHIQLIVASRYMLCALLDELVSITLWPGVEWKKFRLVETFHKEVCDDDSFFLILERSLQDPAANLDLLEFTYLCLRFGYEGKYRGMDRGYLELRNITDQLYNCVRQYRDDFSRGLLIAIETPRYYATKKNYFHLLPPAWVISVFMILTLIITFTSFYLKLTDIATPIATLEDSLKSIQDYVTQENLTKIRERVL